MTTKLILIGGVPGSGKTHIGKELSKSTEAFFIDKDTTSCIFTESLLIALGLDKNDRESELYLSKVKKLEYDTMMSHAFENLSLGNSVICSAPFTSQYKDDNWIKEVYREVNSLDADVVKIWIQTDHETSRKRIVKRGAERDNGKLLNWDEYVKSIDYNQPKNIDNLIIVNNTLPLEGELNHAISFIKTLLK